MHLKSTYRHISRLLMLGKVHQLSSNTKYSSPETSRAHEQQVTEAMLRWHEAMGAALLLIIIGSLVPANGRQADWLADSDEVRASPRGLKQVEPLICVGGPANGTSYTFYEECENMDALEFCEGDCNLGWDGEVSIRCRSDATALNPAKSSCQAYGIELISLADARARRRCHRRPSATGARFRCQYRAYNDVCVGVCRRGWGPVGDLSSTCQSDSTWSPVAGRCKRMCRGTIVDPTDALWSSPAAGCAGTLAGDTCTASCNTGFVAGPDGAPRIDCIDNGRKRPSWGTMIGSCVAGPPPPPPGCATKPSQSNVEYGVYCNGIPYAIGASCEAGCVTGSVSTTAGSYPRATCTLVGGVPTWTYTGGCVGRCNDFNSGPLACSGVDGYVCTAFCADTTPKKSTCTCASSTGPFPCPWVDSPC